MAGIDILDDDALKMMGKDDSRLHLVVDMSRIGAALFNVKMEYTYFAPRSVDNNLFEMALMKWPDKLAILWAITSVPINYRSHVESTAKECGLRLVDGIPMMIGNEINQFPLVGPTVYTLENVSGHKVYSNDMYEIAKLKEEENNAVEAIIKADKDLLFAEMIKDGYTDEQINRILIKWELGDIYYDEVPDLGPESDQQQLLNVLFATPFKFWTCPECERPRVQWRGDVATCVECGKTNKDQNE